MVENSIIRWVFSTLEQDKYLDGRPYVVIGNPKFFIENQTEIVSWLDNCTPNWSIEGTVISFQNRDHQLLFKMTWE